MTTYWCELAWLGDDHPATDVAITVEGDRISEIRTSAAAPAGAVRLPGLTIPGLADTHSHAFHRALRGRTHAGAGTFWTWRDQMYDLAGRLDPDRYRALATATFAEMALAGVSVVGEFHYLHHGPAGRPYDDPNAMAEALRDAASTAGIRLTILDTAYLQGGIGTEATGVQLRFRDADAEAWAARADALRAGPGVRIGAAVHSIRAVAPASMEVVAAWANARGAPLHVHVSEQEQENEQCRSTFGRSPTALLADHGVLGPATTAVHATHLTVDDVALLARTGTSVCLCPSTERDLGDGIGPAARLRGAGVPVHLGSDSHAVIDLLEEARATELDERLASRTRGVHSPAELLTMATATGHAALGWPDTGRLVVGAPADLTTIGLGSVRLAGTEPTDALGAVVFAATAADVHHVVVGGEVVVRDGDHVHLDVAAALDRSIRAVWS